jgi:hypothetical protein
MGLAPFEPGFVTGLFCFLRAFSRWLLTFLSPGLRLFRTQTGI